MLRAVRVIPPGDTVKRFDVFILCYPCHDNPCLRGLNFLCSFATRGEAEDFTAVYLSQQPKDPLYIIESFHLKEALDGATPI
jgi:hypothetical protein